MSDLLERLRADQREALKSQDRLKLSTLRLLSSEIENKRIEMGHEVTDEDVISVLTRARKQRLEAEEQYARGDRPELAEKEAAEAEIILAYLPEPLGDDELDELIASAIEEIGASSMKEMGAVMGHLMPQVQGRVDGGLVSQRVKERLA